MQQAFEYFAPYHAGDALMISTEIAAITTKKDGVLDLIEAHTDAVNQRGQLCVKQRTVLIVRNEGARDE